MQDRLASRFSCFIWSNVQNKPFHCSLQETLIPSLHFLSFTEIDNPAKSVGSKNNTQIIVISVCVAVVALIVLAALVAYCSRLRNRRKDFKEEAVASSVAYSKEENKAQVFENELYSSSTTLKDSL